MELTKEQIIKGLRGKTDMSLKDSWVIAIRWAKMNCLTMHDQYSFLTELYTPEQIAMLSGDE